jgi:hypothetical protein
MIFQIQFKIKGHNNAQRAAEWCIDHFGLDSWEMMLNTSNWDHYIFHFQDKKDATLFALTWAEYA